MMSAPVRPLVIRADASSAIGTGHVMRCIALGQAWSEIGGRVVFVSHQLPAFLKSRLDKEQFELVEQTELPASAEDAMLTTATASQIGSHHIVVDGYHFRSDFRDRLRLYKHRVVAIDDFGGMSNADAIVNSNAYASMADYRGTVSRIEDCPLILVGHEFALLRREFRERSSVTIERCRSPLHILLSCGGSDPKNATERVLQLLQQSDVSDIHVTAVVGGSFQRDEALHRLISSLHFPVTVVKNCLDMPSLMSKADFAITAGGSTCWELACLGVPMVAIITADNQIRVVHAVEAFGLGWNAGEIETLTGPRIRQILSDIKTEPGKLENVSRIASELIDGRGTQRIAEALSNPDVTLHYAGQDDSQMLWEWRNEESVRLASFNSDPIPWENHVRWFTARLDNPNSRILIARDHDGVPVGQVRLDIANDRATISISIAEQFRSAGYGRTLIRKATVVAICHLNVDSVDAFVRPDNVASQRAFQKAGYRIIANAADCDGDSVQQGLHFAFENNKRD